MENLPIFESLVSDLKVFIESLLLIYDTDIKYYSYFNVLESVKFNLAFHLSDRKLTLATGTIWITSKENRNHTESNCSGEK